MNIFQVVYFSGVNIFLGVNIFQEGIFFKGEYYAGVNIFQGEYFSEVNILQGWPFFRGSCSPPKFVQAEFRTVERCLVFNYSLVI